MADRETEQRREAWRNFQGLPSERQGTPTPSSASPPAPAAPPAPASDDEEPAKVSIPMVAISLFLIVTLLFFLTRCGSSGYEENEESEAAPPETPATTSTDAPDDQLPPLGDISGVWEGPVQGDQDWYDIRLDIAPTNEGGWSVGLDYPELGCSGFLESAHTTSNGNVLAGIERLDRGIVYCADGGEVRIHRTDAGDLYWEWNNSQYHVWADVEQVSERESAEAGRDHRFDPLPGTTETNGTGGIYLLPGYGQIEVPTGYLLIRYEARSIHSVSTWDAHEGVDHSFSLNPLADGDRPHFISADQLNNRWDWPMYDYGSQSSPPLIPPPYHYGEEPV